MLISAHVLRLGYNPGSGACARDPRDLLIAFDAFLRLEFNHDNSLQATTATMRRAQSLRSNNARSSVISLTDDLGVLKESEESTEDALRNQLLAAERENDKVISSS